MSDKTCWSSFLFVPTSFINSIIHEQEYISFLPYDNVALTH